MELNWIDVIAIFIGIFNLGLTLRLSMNFEKHIIWHKITGKIIARGINN